MTQRAKVEPIYKAFAKPQQNYFEEAKNGFISITGLMLHSSGYDPYVRLDVQESSERIKIMREWRKSILDIGGVPQHLYIYDETARIEVGDYFTNIRKEIIKATEETDWLEEINELPIKLIASTDVTLGLPMLSDNFRKYFISVGGDIGDRIIDVYIEEGIAKVDVARLASDDAEANAKAGMPTHPLQRDSLNAKLREEAEADFWEANGRDCEGAEQTELAKDNHIAGYLRGSKRAIGLDGVKQFNLIIRILEDYKTHMECHISQYCDKADIIEPAEFLKPYLKEKSDYSIRGVICDFCNKEFRVGNTYFLEGRADGKTVICERCEENNQKPITMRSEILLKRRVRVHRLMMLSYSEHKFEKSLQAQCILREIDSRLSETNIYPNNPNN